MEDSSWRFNNNNMCPTCSIYHFPFCTPLVNNNNSPQFPQPYFNNNNTSPIRPMMRGNVYNNNYADRSVKRMRIGEVGGYNNGTRLTIEDERRLSLIRDHGAPWKPRGVSNSFYDSSVSGYNDGFRFDREGNGKSLRNEFGYPQNDYPYGPATASSGACNYAQDSRQLHGNGFNQGNEFQHTTSVLNSPLSSTPNFENNQSFHIHGPPQNDVRQYVAPMVKEQGSYLPVSTGNSMASSVPVQGMASGVYPPLPPLPPPGTLGVYPPLPPLPPPPIPMEPPGPPPSHLQARVSPPQPTSSLYTIPVTTTDAPPLLHPSAREGQPFKLKSISPDRPKIIDASSLFKRPNRDTRPDHIVIILRGLPGGGKSYLAKMLRDLEVENGGNAPRIHSMDDYFMTEVEKVEESEGSKSSGLVKGKKRVTKKVMEYCYEPEMEEAYRSSMLKAFKKTMEDDTFTFIIVDDRNLRVADFAQFWATAKRSGYEVYLMEAIYKDPVGCAARNIHGFTSDDIKKMAELWEEAPSLYLRLDIQSLFHGDDLEEHGIQEVDMDMEDVACDEGPSALQNRNSQKTTETSAGVCASNDSNSIKDEERWHAEVDDAGVKELGRSKWSQDADEEDIERSEQSKKGANALSGLIQAYTKGDKAVHWGDQIGKTGFSIGTSKRAHVLSLVIGPGVGYNLKSNPLTQEVSEGLSDTTWESKKRSVFEQQLRAERASERESFKTVIDRRRQRIGGLEMEDELQH
ncbi:hypothetical protein IFM89_004929 [Coptis chinensis]|uniref:YLP motif-containing protein 1 n=1 Tax=Coptis chinensis TaxID=261450 RepID=A0A835LQE2_9MAGN|nr:hypothetical protein IFM89_004929 [Coptis chinensis]